VALRIIYRGNFKPAWSTETQVAATLEAMGHTVVRAQEGYGGPGADTDWGWTRITSEAREGADLFLWTQTWPVDPEGGYEALDALRGMGIPSASFHLDLYWGLGRQHQIMDYPFWRTDHVFTADGGHQEGFARNGVNHHWSQPAIYAPDAVTGNPDPQHRWPVIFVGSYPYPHPEHAEWRRQLVTSLQSRFANNFRHYRGGVRGQELADLYASAKVIVGDSCLAGRQRAYWSDRIPETLGRGGFLLHPHIEGLEEHYTDGKHLRTYEPGDLGQLFTLVRWYLAHPDEAAEIAAAGQEHVRRFHTYRHRMETLLATVGLAEQAEPHVA